MKSKRPHKSNRGFVIREFRITDYDSLIDLWNSAGLPHKPKGRDTRQDISREIDHPNAVFIVAEKKGCLIGSAFGTHDGRKGWINRVAVLPAERRKGIAAVLVQEVEKRLREKGMRIIACLVEEWNKESLDFFQKIGYVCHRDIFYLTKREGDHI
ncbi:MAG: GNAT family N-acetyltransferase [candidate division WOR-3 bacterium]|nr:MAG: GNAT family N-acetyltransferase [candidate division WOR-3 bacterium]